MREQEQQLAQIRSDIDNLDVQICDLINQRAKLSKEVSRVKTQHDAKPVFYRPEREAAILRGLMEDYQGELPVEDMLQIFQEIMRASLALQQKQIIAFLGPEGTFSHACVLKHFGHGVGLAPHTTLEQIFSAVQSGEADYGVIPFENSTSGVVTPTLDLLIHSELHVCGEHYLPVRQHLLRHANDTGVIKKVYSHEHSLRQCKTWLDINLPDAERVAVKSNAVAAQLATQERDVAAIAGELAATLYQLQKVQQNIEGSAANTTRFLIIGKQQVTASGHDKTSLVFATPHTPGALIDLMLPFHQNNINVTAISSRPYQHRNWRYIFFLDIEGHRDDAPVKAALSQLENSPVLVNILGAYPQAVQPQGNTA